MKEAGKKYVEGDGWFGQRDSGVKSLASAENDSDGNVMIEVASATDWEGEERRLEDQVRLHLSPIDALLYAERVRVAAVEAIHGEIGEELEP